MDNSVHVGCHIEPQAGILLIYRNWFGLDAFRIKIHTVLITAYSDNLPEYFCHIIPVTANPVSHEVNINGWACLKTVQGI